MLHKVKNVVEVNGISELCVAYKDGYWHVVQFGAGNKGFFERSRKLDRLTETRNVNFKADTLVHERTQLD